MQLIDKRRARQRGFAVHSKHKVVREINRKRNHLLCRNNKQQRKKRTVKRFVASKKFQNIRSDKINDIFELPASRK
jgi:hypothetical protein